MGAVAGAGPRAARARSEDELAGFALERATGLAPPEGMRGRESRTTVIARTTTTKIVTGTAGAPSFTFSPSCAAENQPVRTLRRAAFIMRSDSRASATPRACAHSPGIRRANHPIKVRPAVRVLSGINGSRIRTEISLINFARSLSSAT
jgi:hypothetical protein